MLKAVEAREQAHSQLFKTSKLFDNGQLLVILERFFYDDCDFHIFTRIILRCGVMIGNDGTYTRADVKIVITTEKSL